jgi:hypothetical protein
MPVVMTTCIILFSKIFQRNFFDVLLDDYPLMAQFDLLLGALGKKKQPY